MRLEAEADGERALRVAVNQEHPAADLGKRGAQADRGSGLADAALLVADRDDAGRPVPVERLGIGEDGKRAAGGADDAGTGFRCP